MRFSPTVCLSLLVLAACAHPITQRPAYSPDEVEAERLLETNAAETQPLPPIVEPVYPTKRMKERLQAIVNHVAPQATKLCYDIHGHHADRDGEPEDNTSCTYSVTINGTHGINAYATGNYIVVTAPMMQFLQNDAQLAMVLSHEFAHNIMEHHKLKGSNGMWGKVAGTMGDMLVGSRGISSKGTYSKLAGAQARTNNSPEFEQEADYVGLYILARSGYPIDKAPDTWRAMSRSQADVLYVHTTHPTSPERFVAMQKTIEEIRAKQRAHEPLIPNIQKDA